MVHTTWPQVVQHLRAIDPPFFKNCKLGYLEMRKKELGKEMPDQFTTMNEVVRPFGGFHRDHAEQNPRHCEETRGPYCISQGRNGCEQQDRDKNGFRAIGTVGHVLMSSLVIPSEGAEISKTLGICLPPTPGQTADFCPPLTK
jgi:hypothetical protein